MLAVGGSRKDTMRIVTENSCRAFLRGDTKVCGNTQTDGRSLWLHGNRIAQKTSTLGVVMMSLAGWNTPTTRERLNGLLNLMDMPCAYYQHKYEPYVFAIDRTSNIRYKTMIESNDWLIFVKDDPEHKYIYTEWFEDPKEGHTTALADTTLYETKIQKS